VIDGALEHRVEGAQGVDSVGFREEFQQALTRRVNTVLRHHVVGEGRFAGESDGAADVESG